MPAAFRRALILAPVCWISIVGTFIFLAAFLYCRQQKKLPAEISTSSYDMQLSLRRRTASVHGLFLPVEEYEK
jgi:hypothetical protein